IRAYFSQLDQGLSSDYGETFRFSSVEMIAPGNTGHGTGKGILATCMRSGYFHKTSTIIGMLGVLYGVMVLGHITSKGIEQCFFERIFQIGQNTVLHIVLFVLF